MGFIALSDRGRQSCEDLIREPLHSGFHLPETGSHLRFEVCLPAAKVGYPLAQLSL